KKKIEAVEVKPPCTLRQRVEPFRHYSSRLWTRFGERRRAPSKEEALGGLRKRLAHLDALTAIERQVLDSAPHSAHVVFTNLADPGGAFRPGSGGDKYRFPSHSPPDETPGRIFEHVVGQLLFEARYEPSAASCREVHVRFSAA